MEKNNMNIKILNSSVDGTTNNKGGCAALAEYINHEDEQRLAEGKEILPYTTPDGVAVSIEEVIMKIDRNHSHLGINDDKFYGLVVSPSEDEIKAMGNTEKEIYYSALKLIKAISDTYAQNFNREGINDSSALELFWKPHFTRGDNGEWQFHIHGIVSRKSKGVGGKSVKLSPLTNHRNTENGPVKGGFDRKHFFTKCEQLFDKLFRYERSVAESFEYNNAQAHGTPEEKAKQAELLSAEMAPELKESIASGIARRRASIKEQNDIAEVVAMLEMDNIILPSGKEDTLANAVSLAGFRNDVFRIFGVSASMDALNLNLLATGATCNAKLSEDGVEDIIFVKNGKVISAKDIFDSNQFRKLLNTWEKLTGRVPAYVVRTQNEARLDAERTKELSKKVSQVPHKLKIGR